MKVGKLLYKVSNLEKGIKQWRDMGFTVEYGSKKNPYNAVIYFSEGPFIELVERTSRYPIAKKILRSFWRKQPIHRLGDWAQAEEGWLAMFLISDDPIKVIKDDCNRQGFTGFVVKTKRVDTHNRALRYQMFFPEDNRLPVIMTEFNQDPRPENYIHLNGVKGIKNIIFETGEKEVEILEDVVDDFRLTLKQTDRYTKVSQVVFDME